MRNPSVIRLPILATILSLSVAVSAQDAAEPTPDLAGSPGTTEEETSTPGAAPDARAEFSAGVAAYDAGDYKLAAKHFATAQRLKPHPDVLLNLAQSELLAEQFPAAAKHFSEYLAAPEGTGSETATAGLEQALVHVAQVSVDAPEGATLTLNGEEVGIAPLSQPLFLAPGEHTIATETAETVVTVEPGTKSSVTLSAPSAEVPPEPDLALQETTPTEPSTGRKPFHEWYLNSPVAWVGTGLTAASFLTSGIAAVTASRRYDRSNDAASQIREQARSQRIEGPPCGPPAVNASFDRACRIVVDSADEGDTWSTVSVVTLITGFVLGGATVGYYFIDPKAKNADDIEAFLIPNLGPDQLGLSLSGQF